LPAPPRLLRERRRLDYRGSRLIGAGEAVRPGYMRALFRSVSSSAGAATPGRARRPKPWPWRGG